MKSGDTSGIYFETSSRKTGTTDGTSNPRSAEKFSVFGDGSCGEPLYGQRLNLDFTPNDEIDNDFVQKKVCSFWNFIENTPEIHNLRVKPEIPYYINPSSTHVASESETVKSETEFNKVVHAEKTAVDMLEVVGEKLIGRTLEAKLPQSHCTLGSREYKEMEPVVQQKKKEKKKPTCHCAKVCSPTCPSLLMKGRKRTEYLTPLKKLSRTLNEWDAKHPNCYAFHPLIQRFVRLWKYVQVVSDILTCIISMICCQCIDAMPLSTSSSFGSKPSIQIFETHQMKQMDQVEPIKVDIERSSGEPMKPQHMVIDFTPGREDTPEIQAKCQQFWQFAHNQPELQGMKVQPTRDLEQHAAEITNNKSNLSATPPDSLTQRNNLPAIHMMKKIEKKGVVKAALEAGEVNRSYT